MELKRSLGTTRICSGSTLSSFRRKSFNAHLNAAEKARVNTIVLHDFNRELRGMDKTTLTENSKRIFHHMSMQLRNITRSQKKIFDVLLLECQYRVNFQSKVEVPFDTLKCTDTNARLKTIVIELGRIYHAMRRDVVKRRLY